MRSGTNKGRDTQSCAERTPRSDCAWQCSPSYVLSGGTVSSDTAFRESLVERSRTSAVRAVWIGDVVQALTTCETCSHRASPSTSLHLPKFLTPLRAAVQREGVLEP